MAQSVPSTIKQGIEQYHTPKPDNDLDLISSVRSIMLNSGLGQKIDAYDNDRFIVEASGKTSDVQRFLLNRYWNQQLMASEKQTIEERFCLIPNGTIDDWLRLFQAKVLPFVVENNLPVRF